MECILCDKFEEHNFIIFIKNQEYPLCFECYCKTHRISADKSRVKSVVLKKAKHKSK
jgi:hypothetical protein